MGASYIALDSEKLESFFIEKGFIRGIQGKEVIFTRPHHKNKNLQVKVYSSLAVGEKMARGCGGDAIRICAIFDDDQRSYGIKKFPRIYRVGTEDRLYQRLLERMREAYSCLNEVAKGQPK